MEDWENDNKACLAVIGNALHSRVIKIKEQQAEIDELKKANKFITEGSNRALNVMQDEIDLLNKRIDDLENDCTTLISVKNKQQAEIDELVNILDTCTYALDSSAQGLKCRIKRLVKKHRGK